jgi:hypothetical protein
VLVTGALAQTGNFHPVVETARDPDSGVYGVWLREGQPVDLPYLHGSQVVAQWRDVEPEEGRYDFSAINVPNGRKVTVQINGNRHPDWLFHKVPYVHAKLSKQVQDRQGTLAYWHPAYRAAYLKLIAAYGEHVKAASTHGSIIGVRLNFNALGTEHVDVPPEYRAPTAWTLPPSVAPPPEWTRERMTEYRRAVVDAFIRAFTPATRVFVRNNLFITPDQNDPAWVKMLDAGQLALFHTSSEMEPRGAGGGQYQVFLRYCRSGKTVCYAEPWADAEGNHGGMKDPRWSSPQQFNYWRTLADLHCGVSFIAFYGADLARAGDPEFRAAFDFANRYAGYHASPSKSPGAWIALREGNTLQGDYTFLMQRDPASEMRPVQLAGPKEQRFGAWARVLAGGSTARFTLDPEFARRIEVHAATLRVTYLDTGSGAFTIRAGGGASTVQRKDTGRWQIAEIPVRAWTGGGIAISSPTDLTLHMLEVL